MVSQQAAHVNVVPAVSASFCMHSTYTTYQTICRVMRTCIYSPYYQIVCSRVFLPVNRVTSGDSASTAPKPIYAQVSLTCLCHYKIARHHMIPTIMATTNPRIPMIMSKSAPLVSAIFFSNIVFLFKDHFLIVWSMNELSSADSLSGLVVLPEGRECGCGLYGLSICY
jgi:hypothetical protein